MSESKKIEVLILENDYLIHHTTSQVYADSNVYNVVIQSLIESITGVKNITPVKQGQVPLLKGASKFTDAVPNYVSVTPQSQANEVLPNIQFHPDLVKEGVAPTVIKSIENGIPVVKLDMKSILKGAK